ncbi:BlaI/MecI/CopY family transcriptional regulator [Undibacterium sp. Ji22W]|uniref:BlaI/MecI/CopY family transcriptional regulator n=1 Tax=Undibacterium sp. Ji22W TaxID=3413038 RepID=UPI003BF36625
MMEDDLKNVSLSEPQLALMRVLWSKPNSTVIEVVDAMRQSRPLAHTTIATMLMRLEKRGLITATKEGRQLIYRANLSESEVQKSMVAELLSSVFLGNAKALLSHLLKEDEIKAEDLEQIRQRLNQKN